MRNRRVILSHAGKQHSYYVARALEQIGYLYRFYTSSYVTSKTIQNFLELIGDTYFSRRYLRGLYGKKVKSNWRFEIKEILYARIFGKSGKVNLSVMERDIKFDNFISNKIKGLQGNILWGFQGSCCASLKRARDVGMKTIVELSTAHYPFFYDILDEEKKLHPEWAKSIVYSNFPDHYLGRLKEEPEIADYVIGASEFTLMTLRAAGIPEGKLVLLPLGFDVTDIPFDDQKNPGKGPFKILYAGRISQMKGVKYLLEAVKNLPRKDVELHLIGFKQGSEQALDRYKGHFIWHPPVPQRELFKIYKDYDMLVLPSIFEGFGLVIIEAMAAGLPVITTSHTIGPQIIMNDINGYIVPIRDAKAIESSIIKFLNKTMEEKQKARLAAREAAFDFTWDRYIERLKVFLDRVYLPE